jgi:hypothetical protein
MRKVTILTVLLVCVAFVGAYAETVIEPSVSGDVTLTYGIDLNDPITHGFTADNTVVAELVLTDGYSAEKGSDDAAVYGWIAFEDVSFGLSNNMSEGSGNDAAFYDVEDADGNAWNAEVTGRIMFGDVAWLQIYSASKEAFNYATMVSLDPETAAQVAGTGQQTTLDGLTVEDGAEGQDHDDYPGVTLGIDVDPVMFKLYWMDTVEGYNAKGADVSNSWLLGMSADVDLSIVTFGLYAGTKFGGAEGALLEDGLAFGPEVGLDLAMGGGMGIENTLGADFKMQKVGEETGLLWELANSFVFGLTEDEDGDIASSVALDVSFAPAYIEDGVFVGTTMGDLDVGLTVTEDQSDGLLSGLETSIYYNLLDVLGKNADTDWGMGMEFGMDVAYKAMLDDTYYVEPGAGFNFDMGIMDTDYVSNDVDEIFDMYFQVETMVIPNTTFTLKYATDQLMDEKTAAGTGHMAQDLGEITFATEISF